MVFGKILGCLGANTVAFGSNIEVNVANTVVFFGKYGGIWGKHGGIF